MWIVDTGATSHICVLSALIHNIRTMAKPIQVGFAKARSTPINKVGPISINNAITLDNILPILSSTLNLLSVSQFTSETRCTFSFLSNPFSIQDAQGILIGMSRHIDRLYILVVYDAPTHSMHVPKALVSIQPKIWHAYLGHPYPSRFHFFHNIDSCIPSYLKLLCHACNVSK